MLSKPSAGWTTVTVNNTDIGNASYLDDVPALVLESFIQCLNDMAVNPNLPTHLELTFDAEGYEFGCIIWNRTLYITNNASDKPPYLNVTEVEVDNLDKFIVFLAREAYTDIHDNLDDWSQWNTDADTKEDRETYRKLYQARLSKLYALIILNETLQKQEEV